MNTFKYNSFAKTSQNTIKFITQQTKQETYQNTPYKSSFTLPELKQQMLEAIKQKRNTQVFKPLHKKYPTPLSLLNSNISIPIAQQNEIDMPLNLLKLQMTVTEQILALRQDKLTLMQQYNKLLQTRFKVQRQVLRQKKKQQIQNQLLNNNNQNKTQNQPQAQPQNDKQQRQQQFINFNFFQSNQNTSKPNTNSRQNSRQIASQYSNKITSSQPIQKQRRISIFDQESIKQQDQLLSQIQKLQQSSRIISHKINQRSDNLGLSEDLSLRNQVIGQNNQALIEQRNKLRINRDKLLCILADRLPDYNCKTCLSKLILQNRQLLTKINSQNVTDINLGTNRKKNLQQLRLKFINEQNQKVQFLNNLTQFKNRIKNYKQQNIQLRNKLSYNNV